MRQLATVTTPSRGHGREVAFSWRSKPDRLMLNNVVRICPLGSLYLLTLAHAVDPVKPGRRPAPVTDKLSVHRHRVPVNQAQREARNSDEPAGQTETRRTSGTCVVTR